MTTADGNGDDPTLAEALHQALDRTRGGGPTGLPDHQRGAIDDLLGVARRLDDFVRHVEGGTGLRLVPATPTTQDYVPGTEALPQPFPGDYHFRALLGEGAFGRVWLADDLALGVPVALKTVRLRGDVGQQSRALAALQREAKLMAPLRHPNVVRVHAWRQAGDEHFLVMQYVPGRSLKARLDADGPLGWRPAARYVADAAEALGHVHARGIVHRDIKPANLLWDETTDEVLLTDFGVSAWLAEAGRDAAGTAWYMAPEALQGRAGVASDVYALAATLFHLVTGEPPFAAPSWPEQYVRAGAGLPDPDPRFAAMPAGLEHVIRAALVPDPARRPALAEFAQGLRGCLNQLLADALVPPPDAAAPAVRLSVARRREDGTYAPVAAARRALPTRNLELVPPEPEGVALRTGDRVRIEAVADRTGYLTVFNVGPAGHLTQLYPDPSGGGPTPVAANQPVLIADVQVTPPAGTERVFGVWSREPLALPLADVARQAAGEVVVSAAYRATRNLERVEQSVHRLPGDDWRAAVVELDHRIG